MPDAPSWRESAAVFRYTTRALGIVWRTSKGLSVALAALTVVAGTLPAAAAYVGKLIVDSVLAAQASGLEDDMWTALGYVALEGGLVAALAAAQRGLTVCESLLRALLSHQVHMMILGKAIQLDLPHFEDAEFYDKLTRARREASRRPLSLVKRTFQLVQNLIALVTYAALLLQFSGWAVLALALAGLPAFAVEAKYSGAAFRLFKWRSPETRRQAYLEMVLAREDFAKEVQLYDLGPTFIERYEQIFHTLYPEDRQLTLRRGFWGFVLGLVSTLALYGAYAWIVVSTVRGVLTLGEMTMYLMVFKQGQGAFAAALASVGGMYEDNLYLSNLYDFLEHGLPPESGEAREGAKPGDGIRFEGVTFTYPGARRPALQGITLHVKPGERLALVGENGAGKTTLIKLLTRMYVPSAGRITLDGTDLRDWHLPTLRGRIGVIFQDFVRYQLTVGENIGVGDVTHMTEEERLREAAEKGMATPFIEKMPDGLETQLGRWFARGRELSGGQWQKIALSRAFMRREADILVLDEPTAAMDAEAESLIFDRLAELTRDQIAILISHRFSTVRMADHIVVIGHGRVVEEGSHDELVARDGIYARLFSIQAAGYQ